MINLNPYGFGWKAVKKASAVAREHRQRIAEGDMTIFLFPLTLAIAKDFIVDFLAAIPIAGLVVGTPLAIFIQTYLFIFMWGRGRIWLRIIFLFIGFADIIPGISVIPFDTISVLFAYYLARRDAQESTKALEGAERAQRLARRQIERRIGVPRAQEAKTVG